MKFCLCAVLLLLPAVIYAQHESKQPKVPAIFGSAHTVYVEAWGDDRGAARFIPEEREAIANVQEALRRWNRYVLTKGPEDAELVILVSKHRNAGTSGYDMYAQNGMQSSPIPGIRREENDTARLPDDLFEVRMVLAGGKLSNPIWREQSSGGLDTPQLWLFMKFRDAVERAYPRQTAKPATKP